MGTWSGESFGNDTAADWAGDLIDGGSLATVRETLVRAADTAPEDYLDSDEACEAVAAAEVVAAAAGRSLGPDPYSEDALAWGDTHPEVAELVPEAQAAIARIMAPNSELLELWSEDRDDEMPDPEWKSHVDDLVARLNG